MSVHQYVPYQLLVGTSVWTGKANHEFRQVDVWVRIMEGWVGVGSGSPKFGRFLSSKFGV